MESAADGLKTYSRRRKTDTTNIQSAYTTLMADEGNDSRQEVEQRNMMNTWVWEYVLMQCKDFKLAELLIEQIPVADSPYAKKMLNFKVLYFGGVKEESMNRDLGALEGMEVLYRDDWKGKVPESKKELFDMVQRLQILIRAEFAVKHLRVDDRNGYLSALNKYWSERIQDTEDAAMDDPSIAEFRKQVKEDLAGVLKRPNLRTFVLDEYKRERLEEGIKRFLELAKVDLGPSFLEKAAEDVLQGRYVPGKKRASERAAGGGGNKRRKTVARREEDQRGRGRSSSSPEAEDLEKARSDLKKHVKDPLPGALEVAKELKGRFDGTNKVAAAANQPTPEAAKSVGNSRIYERQSSARAVQWTSEEEDVEEPGEDSPSASKGVQLPKSPATAKLSPLRKPEAKSDVKPESGKRRKKHRWTEAEETALRAGVKEHGKGRWKLILTQNLDVFPNRTEVDLKDKWRNIEKYDPKANM